MKIVTIIGARPQFVKAAVVSAALLQQGIEEVLVHTGQHFDAEMSDVFFHELGLAAPRYHLGIGGGTHGQNTGRMLEQIEQVLLKEQPTLVLVYGDTDSTLAGSIAAAKLHIKVAHVEAGLRSFNRKMPEEINRILADHIADYLFAPTSTAVNNLTKEGIDPGRIALTGDVMYDAALQLGQRARLSSPELSSLHLQAKQFILMTVHRAENADDPVRLKHILDGMGAAALPVVWPLHPRTKKQLAQFNLTVPENIRIVPPVGYLEMTWLESHAAVIATDSGGVQKEAYFHRVPCVTLRNETEWAELVECGANLLAGANSSSIAAALEKAATVEPAVFGNEWYGNGTAGESIAAFIRQIAI